MLFKKDKQLSMLQQCVCLSNILKNMAFFLHCQLCLTKVKNLKKHSKAMSLSNENIWPLITRHLDESHLQRSLGERASALHCIRAHGIFESDCESCQIQRFACQSLLFGELFKTCTSSFSLIIFIPSRCLHDDFSFQLSCHSDCIIRLCVNVVSVLENLVPPPY